MKKQKRTSYTFKVLTSPKTIIRYQAYFLYMLFLKKIDELLNIYNKENFDYLKVLDKNKIDVCFEKDEESFKAALPADSSELLIVTDSAFSGSYLEGLGIYKSAKIWKIEEESMEEVEKVVAFSGGCVKVMGFGGGRPLDVAKMVALKLGKPLVSVPTAPSHDGLVARNCALKEGGIKKSFSTLYPECVIVPEHLWKGSGNLRLSGILDVLSSIVSLQDVSLSMARNGFKPDSEYMVYSLIAVRRLLAGQDMDSFAAALIISGLAMHEHSNYCSGSEHEIEKIVCSADCVDGSRHLHGQLAGAGALIAAKVYEMYGDKMPSGLFFDSEIVYSSLVQVFERCGVLLFALEPIVEHRDDLEKLFEGLHKVRPERYTLWNFVNPEMIDWKKVLDEIIKEKK